MQVVAHLLALVADDLVGLAGRGRGAEIGEEAVQQRAAMARAGDAAGAEAGREHAEAPAILLHRQVRGRLGDAEQAVGGMIDRHLLVDAVAMVRMVAGDLEARRLFHHGQAVRVVAVDFVRAHEDERRAGAVRAGALEQRDGGGRVDGEVGGRVVRRPVVRGLRRGMDDDRDLRAELREDGGEPRLVADVHVVVAVAAHLALQRGPLVERARLRPEEDAALVVVDADDLEAEPGELAHRLRADEPGRAGDDGDRAGLHYCALRSTRKPSAKLRMITRSPQLWALFRSATAPLKAPPRNTPWLQSPFGQLFVHCQTLPLTS